VKRSGDWGSALLIGKAKKKRTGRASAKGMGGSEVDPERSCSGIERSGKGKEKLIVLREAVVL